MPVCLPSCQFWLIPLTIVPIHRQTIALPGVSGRDRRSKRLASSIRAMHKRSPLQGMAGMKQHTAPESSSPQPGSDFPSSPGPARALSASREGSRRRWRLLLLLAGLGFAGTGRSADGDTLPQPPAPLNTTGTGVSVQSLTSTLAAVSTPPTGDDAAWTPLSQLFTRDDTGRWRRLDNRSAMLQKREEIKATEIQAFGVMASAASLVYLPLDVSLQSQLSLHWHVDDILTDQLNTLPGSYDKKPGMETRYRRSVQPISASSRLDVTLWQDGSQLALDQHPLVRATLDGLLVQLPPGRGVLVAEWNGPVAITSERLQAWEVGHRSNLQEWWDFDQQLDATLRRWPEDAGLTLPQPPAVDGSAWALVQALFDRLSQPLTPVDIALLEDVGPAAPGERATDSPAATLRRVEPSPSMEVRRRVLQAAVRLALLPVRPLASPFYETLDLTRHLTDVDPTTLGLEPLAVGNAPLEGVPEGPETPEAAAFKPELHREISRKSAGWTTDGEVWLQIPAGVRLRIPFPGRSVGEGLLVLETRAVWPADAPQSLGLGRAAVQSLQVTVGQLPRQSLRFEAAPELLPGENAGQTLKTQRGEPLSTVRSWRLVRHPDDDGLVLELPRRGPVGASQPSSYLVRLRLVQPRGWLTSTGSGPKSGLREVLAPALASELASDLAPGRKRVDPTAEAPETFSSGIHEPRVMGALAQALLGNLEQALPTLQRAADRAEEGHNTADSLLLYLLCARWQSEPALAHRLLARAEQLALQVGAPAPALNTLLEDTRMSLLLRSGKAEALVTALETHPLDLSQLLAPTDALSQALALLESAEREEWRRSRSIPLLLAAESGEQDNAATSAPRRTTGMRVLREGLGAAAGWQGMNPEKLGAQALVSDPVAPTLEPFVSEVESSPSAGQKSQALCPDPASLTTRAVYRLLPEQDQIHVTIPAARIAPERPVRVSFQLLTRGTAPQVKLGVDGHWKTLYPVDAQEDFSLPLLPGPHILQWESAWETQLLMRTLPDMNLMARARPTDDGQLMPLRPLNACTDLYVVRQRTPVEDGLSFRLPEPFMPGFVRIEVSHRSPDSMATVDATSVLKNGVQQVSSKADIKEFLVHIGDQSYPIQYELRSEGHELSAVSTGIPRFVTAQASSARLLAGEGAPPQRVTLPVPAGVERIWLESRSRPGLQVRVSFLKHGAGDSFNLGVTPGPGMDFSPLTDPGQQQDALQQLSRLSNALRERLAQDREGASEALASVQAPASTYSARIDPLNPEAQATTFGHPPAATLYLSRGLLLLRLEQSELARLELHAALSAGLVGPARGQAEAALQFIRAHQPLARLSSRTGTPARDPLLSLPDKADPPELNLSPAWKALKSGREALALKLLETEARQFPDAWQPVWLQARIASSLGHWREAGEAYAALAALSPTPGSLWLSAAQSFYLALETAASHSDAPTTAQAGTQAPLAPADEPARLALLGWNAATRAVEAGEPEAVATLAQLSRYSRWKSLLNVDDSAGVETLTLSTENGLPSDAAPESSSGMPGGTPPTDVLEARVQASRVLRARVQEALLGIPWRTGEGVRVDPQHAATATLNFRQPTRVRLDLFCAWEGGVVNDQGDAALMQQPCEALVMENGVLRSLARVPTGRMQRFDLGALQGRQVLEVLLNDRSLERQLGVRVWSEGPGEVAALGHTPPASRSGWIVAQEGLDERLSGERDADWQVVTVTPRRKVFVATAEAPVTTTLQGPTWLQVEARALLERPRLTGAAGTSRARRSRTGRHARTGQRTPADVTPAPVHLVLSGWRMDAPEDAVGQGLYRQKTLPIQLDPNAQLEGRTLRRVGEPELIEVAIPEGTWSLMLTASASASVFLRVRDAMRLHTEPPRAHEPLEPVSWAGLTEPVRARFEAPPALNPPQVKALRAAPTLEVSLGVSQSRQEVVSRSDAEESASIRSIVTDEEDSITIQSADTISHYSSIINQGLLSIRLEARRGQGLLLPAWFAPDAVAFTGTLEGNQSGTLSELSQSFGSQLSTASPIVGATLRYGWPLELAAFPAFNRASLRLTGSHSIETQSGLDAFGYQQHSALELKASLGAGEGNAVNAVLPSFLRFRPALGLAWRDQFVTGVGQDSNLEGGGVSSRFSDDWTAQHPVNLYLQAETLARPLADVLWSARLKAIANPDWTSLDQLSFRLSSAQWLGAVQAPLLLARPIGVSTLALAQELRLGMGVPDANRKSPELTVSGAFSARVLHALTATSALAFSLEGRYFPPLGSLQDSNLVLGLTVGFIQHGGRALSDTFPGQEAFRLLDSLVLGSTVSDGEE